MAFLDFLKDRAARQQADADKSQPPKPETAKQMYTREAVEEVANRKLPTPDQQKRSLEVGKEFEAATKQMGMTAPAPAGESDGSTNSAQLQKQNNQGKPQEALSPTDDGNGKTDTQAKPLTPEKTQVRPSQTIARRPPSWER